mmetsp:Transcript_40054/g.114088  ORF Transcript_40054/g.114088 Transcript_40054/m.114088 type:complete len:582 (-) Transcript_40054:2432-4177(-)
MRGFLGKATRRLESMGQDFTLTSEPHPELGAELCFEPSDSAVEALKRRHPDAMESAGVSNKFHCKPHPSVDHPEPHFTHAPQEEGYRGPFGDREAFKWDRYAMIRLPPKEVDGGEGRQEYVVVPVEWQNIEIHHSPLKLLRHQYATAGLEKRIGEDLLKRNYEWTYEYDKQSGAKMAYNKKKKLLKWMSETGRTPITHPYGQYRYLQKRRPFLAALYRDHLDQKDPSDNVIPDILELGVYQDRANDTERRAFKVFDDVVLHRKFERRRLAKQLSKEARVATGRDNKKPIDRRFDPNKGKKAPRTDDFISFTPQDDSIAEQRRVEQERAEMQFVLPMLAAGLEAETPDAIFDIDRTFDVGGTEYGLAVLDPAPINQWILRGPPKPSKSTKASAAASAAESWGPFAMSLANAIRSARDPDKHTAEDIDKMAKLIKLLVWMAELHSGQKDRFGGEREFAQHMTAQGRPSPPELCSRGILKNFCVFSARKAGAKPLHRLTKLFQFKLGMHILVLSVYLAGSLDGSWKCNFQPLLVQQWKRKTHGMDLCMRYLNVEKVVASPHTYRLVAPLQLRRVVMQRRTTRQR